MFDILRCLTYTRISCRVCLDLTPKSSFRKMFLFKFADSFLLFDICDINDDGHEMYKEKT